MIPDTAMRVAHHTAPHVNERIQQKAQERISAYGSGDRAAVISYRLGELGREWDVERTLQTNFAVFSMIGLALATSVNKRWYAMAGGVPAFMVQHALQGWCPPLAALRRFGFRTSKEINEERFALKAMRGDFDEAARSRDVDAILRAVRSQDPPDRTGY
ncbi:hypothetical protein GCM10027343_01810 [Noviherbaspirillum agri]